MNITATLKALPFLSILAASLAFTPSLSMAGDNSHRQHNNSSAQHSKKTVKQAHHRSNSHRTIRHQQQARPHRNRSYNNHGAMKRHYKARSHYRSYQPHHIANAHAYTVTRVYQPAPVVHAPVVTHITPAISLGLHTGNVTLSLNSH